jgi:hypothetical protein
MELLNTSRTVNWSTRYAVTRYVPLRIEEEEILNAEE